MVDNKRLREALFSRSGLGPMSPAGLPTGLPAQKPQLKPAWQRYMTGLKMQEAYANNWNPNPMMIRILDGGKK